MSYLGELGKLGDLRHLGRLGRLGCRCLHLEHLGHYQWCATGHVGHLDHFVTLQAHLGPWPHLGLLSTWVTLNTGGEHLEHSLGRLGLGTLGGALGGGGGGTGTGDTSFIWSLGTLVFSGSLETLGPTHLGPLGHFVRRKTLGHRVAGFRASGSRGSGFSGSGYREPFPLPETCRITTNPLRRSC